MEIKEYIESGILDLYVLGNLSAEEKAGVECMIASHPELQIELEIIQSSLNNYTSTFEKEVPAELKSKIMGSLDFSENKAHEAMNTSSIQTTNIATSEEPQQASSTSATKVFQLTPFYKIAIAASLLVLFCSIGMNLWLSSNLNETNNRLAQADKALQQNNENSIALNKQLTALSSQAKLLAVPGNMIVSLASVAKNTEDKATVIWNKNNKSTYIVMDHLPVQNAEKQYQLWAIVDGKPVDLGVLPQQFNKDSILQTKFTDQPQAFAITIEPKGGSINPTLAQLIVMGNL